MTTLPKFPASELVYGFTGTQRGMTKQQAKAVRWQAQRITKRAMANKQTVILHHGDCIGSDEEMHTIALRYGWDVIIRPPVDDSKRAYCEGAKLIMPAKPYLARNYDIALAGVDGLLATPEQSVEQRRSGTWATIRYARRLHRPVMIFDRYDLRPPCTSTLL